MPLKQASLTLAVLFTAAVTASAQSASTAARLKTVSMPRPAEHATLAETESRFDVVTIKPSKPDSQGLAIRPDPNRFAVTGASLSFLIEYAYDLHDFQLLSKQGWIKSARFDILAKVDEPGDPHASLDERQALVRKRLRALLEDRFQLLTHPDSVTMPIYGLVVAKHGPKLQLSSKNTGYLSGMGHFDCSDASMDGLASMLSDQLNRIVVDRTNLTGEYAFRLQWAPDGVPASNAALPGIFTALREQLGLQLVPDKGPVPILVVDRVEQPSEN